MSNQFRNWRPESSEENRRENRTENRNSEYRNEFPENSWEERYQSPTSNYRNEQRNPQGSWERYQQQPEFDSPQNFRGYENSYGSQRREREQWNNYRNDSPTNRYERYSEPGRRQPQSSNQQYGSNEWNRQSQRPSQPYTTNEWSNNQPEYYNPYQPQASRQLYQGSYNTPNRNISREHYQPNSEYRTGYGFNSDSYNTPSSNHYNQESSNWNSPFGNSNRESNQQNFRGYGPSNYTRSDERIIEDINDRLSDSPYLDARELDVKVSQGEVTLQGNVDSRHSKRFAEDICESVSGVRHVENRVRYGNIQNQNKFESRSGNTTSQLENKSSNGSSSSNSNKSKTGKSSVNN